MDGIDGAVLVRVHAWFPAIVPLDLLSSLLRTYWLPSTVTLHYCACRSTVSARPNHHLIYGTGHHGKNRQEREGCSEEGSEKQTAKPATIKPIKETLSKSALVAHLAESSALAAKDVRTLLGALENTIHASLHKKGVGSFTLPGLLKISTVNVPAKPKRKGINPFTKEEQWFAAKPASVKIKTRPLKKLKDATL